MPLGDVHSKTANAELVKMKNNLVEKSRPCRKEGVWLLQQRGRCEHEDAMMGCGGTAYYLFVTRSCCTLKVDFCKV